MHVYASGAYALRVGDSHTAVDGTVTGASPSSPTPRRPPRSVRVHVSDEFVALKEGDEVEIRAEKDAAFGSLKTTAAPSRPYVAAFVDRTPDRGAHSVTVNFGTKAQPRTVSEVEIRNRLPVGVLALLVTELVTAPVNAAAADIGGEADGGGGPAAAFAAFAGSTATAASPLNLVQNAVRYLMHRGLAVLSDDLAWALPWARQYLVETSGRVAEVGNAVLNDVRCGVIKGCCGPSCTLSHHGKGNCVVCGQPWSKHQGHTCLRTGARGAWPLSDDSGRGDGKSGFDALESLVTENVPFSLGRNRVPSSRHGGRGSDVDDDRPSPVKAVRLFDEFRSVAMGIAYAVHASTSPTM